LTKTGHWNQPVLSNEVKVSASIKQQEPLIGFDLTIDKSDAPHCNTLTFKTTIARTILLLLTMYCSF